MKLSAQRKRELLGEEVGATLRAEILGGNIKPGSHLSLAPLAEKMGTSITPVREALLQLSQDGWVIHEAHRGFRVAPLNREDVQDTYFIWATAEGEIARRAAIRAQDGDVYALREIDYQLRKLENHHTNIALVLNQELHAAIHTISNSSKLVWFADTALRSVPLRFTEVFQFVPGWAEINRYGHTQIVDAIEVHDGPRAETLMREHFLTTGNLLVEQLDQIGLWNNS